MSKPETKNENVTTTSNVTTYDDVTTMEKKDIAKELRELAPRGGRMSLTERNMLECLSEGGTVTSDTRDAKKRTYAHFMTYADGVSVSLRPDGFRYLVSKAQRYGLVSVKSEGDMVTTWSLPKNSNRRAFVARLVELFDNC